MKRVIPALCAILPAMAMAQSTQGPYIGSSLGYMTQEDSGEGYYQGGSALSGYAHESNPASTTLGLLGGYRWQLNEEWIFGLEADYEFRRGNDRSFQKYEGLTDTDYAVKTRNTAAASIRGQAGYRLNAHSLLFFTGGFAAAKVKRAFYDDVNGDSEYHSGWQKGWTAGLGLEHSYTNDISARIEYRYSDYGDETLAVDMWGEDYKQDLTEESLKISVLYRF